MRPSSRLGSFLFVLAISSVGGSSFAADEAPPQPGQRLRQVISAHWDDLLRSHPLAASIMVGDQRFSDRLDDASTEAYEAWLNRLDSTREALEDFDAETLNPDERLDREILLAALEDRLRSHRFGDHLVPLAPILRYAIDLHFTDLHLLFAQLGEFHPASTRGDLENYLLRLKQFPAVVDGIIGTLKQGISEKRLAPRVVMPKVLTQLRSLGTTKPEESPFWAIVARLPGDWSEAEAAAIKGRIREAVANDVLPAYSRLAEFVEKTYMPACPDRVGLASEPDGAEHYAFLVRSYTTSDLTPDQVHEIGLAEIRKTRQAMDGIRQKVGFPGDLAAFLAHTRTDARFKNTSESSILQGHREIIATMEANLPRLFGRLPRIPLEVRPFEPIRAKSSPTGEYYPAASDGSRPGIFFVNTSDPTSRPTYTMQALAYHEAVPGHHLQVALGLEAPGRPPFRRYFYFPAFDEGWALYTESLPEEIGLYTDPYAIFGRLNYDALRCARLVVDTGMHHKRWTREQAIVFMEANTSLPRNEIENEVDRYIAWPGQALAYKIGELKIRELRDRAAKKAGQAFDLRAFHDRLLSFGSVPLRLLERLLDSDPRP